MALRVLYFTFYIQQLDLQNLDKFCLTDSENNLAAGKLLVSLRVILGFSFCFWPYVSLRSRLCVLVKNNIIF